MEKNSRVMHAGAWAVEGCWGEKNSRVKGAQAWTVQGWVISWVGRIYFYWLFTDYWVIFL